ncbi:hypothetical protein WSM22_35150 [Cytophagales bacterium WSM2-2]|nr:hypothetical protein WSM22_35150 [Cytophagales bacterium WSM2-2]
MYCLIVLLIVFTELTQYERRLKDNFSTLKNKSLSWLRNLVIALFGLWVLWSAPYIYEVFSHDFLQWHHYPLWIGMSVVVYWIGYSAFSRAEIFQAPVFIEREPVGEKSKLSDKTDEYHQQLIHFMSTKKPYLNPELSLESMAKEIDLSAGYLSQILNKKEEISFYDFVNKYRVEEAKRILVNPKFSHYSILAIGLESGFNSKSTFNSAFKKYSGTTPTGFKNQNKSHK